MAECKPILGVTPVWDYAGIIEAKIYSRTNIFSDHRLQRSKHSNNSARSSQQQDMQVLGYFSISETFVVCMNSKKITSENALLCFVFFLFYPSFNDIVNNIH